MAHQHRGRGQHKEYLKRFTQRYGMTQTEWRELKKTNPKKAHEIRMKLGVN